jgi:hypothetical protein
MPVSTFLIATVVVGIVVNVFDAVVHGFLLQGPLYSTLPLMRTDAAFPLLILTDFVAAAVFVWVYLRLRASFSPGAAGGATFGLYAGVLVNFPTWIACYLILSGFTSSLAWAWTLAGILWCVVAGAVVGAVVSRSAPASVQATAGR